MPDRVCICTVTARSPHWAFLESVFQLKAPSEKLFKRIAGKQGIDDGHNLAVEWFLEYTDYEWMLSLDDDAVVHRDTLLRLLSWDVKFVSALAFQRRPPFPPVVYTEPHPTIEGSFVRPVGTIVEWVSRHRELIELGEPTILSPRPDDALFEVSRGGMHCCLVHRNILESIEPPWFVKSGAGAKTGSGSDFIFYKKAREAGARTYVDLSVVAGHLVGDMCIGAIDFMVWDNISMWSEGGQRADIRVPLIPQED